MRIVRTTSAAFLSLLLALVIDGTLLLACPAFFGRTEVCLHCSRTKTPHCPDAPGDQVCPLVSPGQLAGEFVPVASGATPALPHWLPMAADVAVPVTDSDDWHHHAGLYLRLQVLRN